MCYLLFVCRKDWGLNCVKIYCKIPKISPDAYIFHRPFLRGLFLEGLIFSEGLIYKGKFAFQNRLGTPL